MIYHILHRAEWERAKETGVYFSSRFESTGFIHCSTLEKIVPIANFNYKNMNDMVILEIDEKKIVAEIKWEDLYGDEYDFPHIYGKMDLEAVNCVYDFPADRGGTFQLPKALLEKDCAGRG